MNDLIDRQAAIEAVRKCSVKEVTPAFMLVDKAEVMTELMMLPSAQPEIIQCKDCKWWSNDDYRECSSPNYDDGYVTPAGFYCGYAERRTDG